MIRKAVLVCVLALTCISAIAQSHIKVDAPGIVGADEQFNVTFSFPEKKAKPKK